MTKNDELVFPGWLLEGLADRLELQRSSGYGQETIARFIVVDLRVRLALGEEAPSGSYI